MAGPLRVSREPRQETRERRNSQRLGGNTPLVLADASLVQSGAGLAVNIDGTQNVGLQLGAAGLFVPKAAVAIAGVVFTALGVSDCSGTDGLTAACLRFNNLLDNLRNACIVDEFFISDNGNLLVDESGNSVVG